MIQRKQVKVYCDPHPHQWEAWEASKANQVTWMCGGLGAGKTWAMVWWCWFMATEWAPEVDGLLFEPDYATYEDVFLKLFRELIPGEGVLWSVKRTTSGRQLHIHVRKARTVTIFVRSAMNAQNVMRSEGLTTVGWTALDEPARMLCGGKAFTNSLGRSRVQIPGWEHNPIFMVGSPRGLGHWTAEAMGCTSDHPEIGYYRCYEPDPAKHPGYVIRACRSADNEKNLAKNWERNARIGMSRELADQEFNASLTHASGMVLPEWNQAIHVLPHEQIMELWNQRVRRPLGGVDWGYHTSANEVCGWTGDKLFLVADENYSHGITDIEQGVLAHEMNQRYAMKTNAQGNRTMPWYCDPENRGAREQWKKGFEWRGKYYVIGAKQAKNAWQAGVDRIRHQLAIRPGMDHPGYPPGNMRGCPGMFVSERCAGLIEEAPKYRHLAKEEGKPLKDGHASADPLCDDHAIDAIRYPLFTTATTLPTRSYGSH
jgi:hypothetical protein